MVHVLEHMPNKCEALSSNPSTAKKEKKKKHPENKNLKPNP
jgi:hypothetical protein